MSHQHQYLREMAADPARIIDFFEARHGLLTDSQRIAEKSGMDRQIKEPGIRRKRADELAGAFEQTYYWVVWAAVLAGLALGIFGL